ncbi:MAG: hypothetical protein MJ164_03985 [Alphaproteobacteria bacterium]|nr:hypothetical protein [Alphaproteobacteria bacterium]
MKKILFGLFCLCNILFVETANATLPSDYTELEYIESTGTQYIDTGIIGKTGISAEAKFILTSLTATSALLGNRSSSESRFWVILQFNQKWDVTIGADTQVGQVEKNKIYTTYFNSSSSGWYFDVNGMRVSSGSGISNNTNNLWMFAVNNMGASQYHFTGKVYYVKLWNGDDLVRSYIPARRNSDTKIGMYDTVSGTFFTNAGTGDFIAGPIAHCKTFGTDGVTCTACESGYKLDNNGGCVGVIQIATTKMVDEEFAAAEAKLATTVQTIESVVSRTITQTGQIATLQAEKQTRPDETCPAGKKCLLVQDEDGTPHWYEIIEP